MKLYATVASERATKGQGGDYLDIEIFNEEKELITTIKVRQHELGRRIVVWHDSDTVVDSYRDSQLNTKGKKQKGKCEHIEKYGPYFTGECPICKN